jgi:hypothetical protein
MQRTDLQDTSIEMHRMLVKLLREKGPEWRIQKTFEMVDASRELFREQTKRSLAKERRPE